MYLTVSGRAEALRHTSRAEALRHILSADAGGAGLQAGQADDPDALYAQRENLASATRAAEIWNARLKKNSRDFESAWKLAKAQYWLGGHLPDKDARRRALEAGMAAARVAIAVEPKKPEGHFWLAANMGALAESFGLRAGLKHRGPIREELELVLKLDPAFQQGSADRALGRWYYRVPGLFGGSKRKSEEHLRKALTFNPDSTISHLFLAETLLELDREAEARAELKKVLDAPIDPDWAPEDREFKKQAAELLKRLR